MFAWLVRNTLGRRLPEFADHGLVAVRDEAWMRDVVRDAPPALASVLRDLARGSEAHPGQPTVAAVPRGGAEARVLAQMTRSGWSVRMTPVVRTPTGPLDPFALTDEGRAVVCRVLGEAAVGVD